MIGVVSENALLVMVSVSKPFVVWYLTVIVQLPPGATGPLRQVSVSVKLLFVPLPKVSALILSGRFPVLFTVVVSVEPTPGNFMAPEVTSSFATKPLTSVT